MADDEQAKHNDEQTTVTPTSTADKEESSRLASASTSTDTTDSSSAPAPKSDEPSTSTSSESTPAASSSGTPSTAWQAIFSPQHNAYYFYNSETQETTWVNPLDPSAQASTSASQDAATDSSDTPAPTDPLFSAMHAAALAAGVDPALAHLDPSLAYGATGASGGPVPAFTAKFNARTGAFAPSSSRDPSHLSEYERAKRMSEFYFDVNEWEKDVARRKAEEDEAEREGKKRKRPTKKDLERFKEQKRLKKIAKTAWLRQ